MPNIEYLEPYAHLDDEEYRLGDIHATMPGEFRRAALDVVVEVNGNVAYRIQNARFRLTYAGAGTWTVEAPEAHDLGTVQDQDWQDADDSGRERAAVLISLFEFDDDFYARLNQRRADLYDAAQAKAQELLAALSRNKDK